MLAHVEFRKGGSLSKIEYFKRIEPGGRREVVSVSSNGVARFLPYCGCHVL